MATKLAGQIPLQRSRVGGISPCESCGYRKAKVKITMQLGPTAEERVTHRLCSRCDPKQ